jgi:hypothetical protein
VGTPLDSELGILEFGSAIVLAKPGCQILLQLRISIASKSGWSTLRLTF